MDSTMADKLAGSRLASLEEQFSNLAQEAGFGPPAPPPSEKTPRDLLTTVLRSADWRHAAVAGCLLVASVGAATWWWSSPAETAKVTSAPIQLAQAAEAVAPKAAAPKEAAPAAPSTGLEQQLEPMARDLAALRQVVEQLTARQEQLVRDNQTLASQLAASREEIARSNGIVDQLKATQVQMARENQALAERVNASEQQLAGVTGSISESKAALEPPKAVPEPPKLASDDAPKVMPETPLPRPRAAALVAHAQKPAPRAARPPQARKPQPAWPWSPR